MKHYQRAWLHLDTLKFCVCLLLVFSDWSKNLMIIVNSMNNEPSNLSYLDYLEWVGSTHQESVRTTFFSFSWSPSFSLCHQLKRGGKVLRFINLDYSWQIKKGVTTPTRSWWQREKEVDQLKKTNVVPTNLCRLVRSSNSTYHYRKQRDYQKRKRVSWFGK